MGRGETVFDGPPLDVIFNRQWTKADRLQTRVLRERWYQYPLDRSVDGLLYQEDVNFRTWE